MSTAQPLNLSIAIDGEKTPTPLAKSATAKPKTNGIPTDISTPHELTTFVDKLLAELDTKFEEMSSQILDRMNQMSSRVDALESSLQDIINGDITTPTSPAPLVQGIHRSQSGLA